MAIDFFTVPSATFHVLFVFIVLAHDRRRVLHFNVTEHPCPYRKLRPVACARVLAPILRWAQAGRRGPGSERRLPRARYRARAQWCSLGARRYGDTLEKAGRRLRRAAFVAVMESADFG